MGIVLQKLQEYNLRINLNKSKFFMEEIQYCGFIIRADGIRKDKAKLEAIKKMPRPRNTHELRSFMGMINYYGRFIRNLSSIL